MQVFSCKNQRGCAARIGHAAARVSYACLPLVAVDWQDRTEQKMRWALLTRVFHKNIFLKKRNGSTYSVNIWGLLWRNPKGFLVLKSFRGHTTHFLFWPILHCRFSLSPHFAGAPGKVRAEWKSTKMVNGKNSQNRNGLCTPYNFSKSKIILDSFKATPRYLLSGLSYFFSSKNMFPAHILVDFDTSDWFNFIHQGLEWLPRIPLVKASLAPILP